MSFRYHIRYMRDDGNAEVLDAHQDADTMIKALGDHAWYWKQQDVQVRHVSCTEGRDWSAMSQQELSTTLIG